MKVCAAHFTFPSRGRFPPDFHFTSAAGILVTFGARREGGFQMKRLGARLVERAALDGFPDGPRIVGCATGWQRQGLQSNNDKSQPAKTHAESIYATTDILNDNWYAENFDSAEGLS